MSGLLLIAFMSGAIVGLLGAHLVETAVAWLVRQVRDYKQARHSKGDPDDCPACAAHVTAATLNGQTITVIATDGAGGSETRNFAVEILQPRNNWRATDSSETLERIRRQAGIESLGDCNYRLRLARFNEDTQ